MANPFLVLGGIAVGIITAAFGVLAVPGWVASAQDASAKNDLAQITIGQSASLSTTGYVKPAITTGGSITDAAQTLNGDARVGVSVTTQATGANVAVLPSGGNSHTTSKSYAVAVKSGSNKVFVRIDGGPIRVISGATVPADFAAAQTAWNAGTAG